MTSKYLFPALDTDGWVETSVKTADYLLSHFFLSDYSQTFHFKNNVASFSWILQQYQSNLSRIQEETQQTLSSYFSKQFSEVEVQVTEMKKEDSANVHELTLFLVFTDKDGIRHNIARMIKHNGMRVSEIIAVIMEG